MSVFANHFGSDIGKELFTELGSMSADARVQFLSDAEGTNPGIAEEYNVKHSMENIGNTSVIKDFGSALGYTSSGLAGLSADIDAASATIDNIKKGDIDEHLLTIEQLSGIDITAEDEDGNRLYANSYEYLRSAKNAFNNYISDLKKDKSPGKHIQRVKEQWNASYEVLWPTRTAMGVQGAKEDYLQRGPMKYPSDISQDLKDLYELNVMVEDYQSAYDQQFIDPVTVKQSDLAKSLYEESIK